MLVTRSQKKTRSFALIFNKVLIHSSARVHRKLANENRRTQATSFHFDRAISVFTVLAIQKYIRTTTTTTKRNETFGLTFCKAFM